LSRGSVALESRVSIANFLISMLYSNESFSKTLLWKNRSLAVQQFSQTLIYLFVRLSISFSISMGEAEGPENLFPREWGILARSEWQRAWSHPKSENCTAYTGRSRFPNMQTPDESKHDSIMDIQSSCGTHSSHWHSLPGLSDKCLKVSSCTSFWENQDRAFGPGLSASAVERQTNVPPEFK
jgi:hypothetical protein